MPKNSARIDFNLSILEDSLDRQVSDIMQELANKPNKLLIRCIKQAAGENIRFSGKQLEFLKDNFIAKTEWQTTCCMGDTDTREFFDKFLPPWNGFFKQLGSRLNNTTLNLQNP